VFGLIRFEHTEYMGVVSVKCMCKANHPDPDIREEYCDGATMTLYDFEVGPHYYCHECGKYESVEVTV